MENSGSDVFFSYHVEDAIHQYKPDYLALYCLKSDYEKVAITETASISEAIKNLNDSTLNILRKPMYELHPSASFNSSHLSRKVSVIGGSQKQPKLLIYETLMQGIEDEAEKTLNELKEILPKVSNGVQLNPGELIILDNNKVAHARSAFKPRYDGEDRWLQRMFSINDLKGLENYMKGDENTFIPLVDI
ncbi:TauD/TfdA family dioxygenase, partial [Staphylococcus aureus]|uniref:TauD/TfdA family dioxygenase n=1 Tax=Staphylococcus aureus TaxID=1280 RepID=UPI0039BE9F36